MDEFLNLREFPVGDDAQQHLFGFSAVSAFCLENRDAAVDFGKNCLTDLCRVRTDDFDFCPGGPHQKQLIHRHRVDQHDDDSVKCFLRRMEECLQQQDAEIHRIERERNRNPEIMVQDQGRNIHAAGGGTGTDD